MTNLLPEAENGMRTWLADNPQDKFGKHEYKLAQFGLARTSSNRCSSATCAAMTSSAKVDPVRELMR